MKTYSIVVLILLVVSVAGLLVMQPIASAEVERDAAVSCVSPKNFTSGGKDQYYVSESLKSISARCFRLDVPMNSPQLKLNFEVFSGEFDLYHTDQAFNTLGNESRVNFFGPITAPKTKKYFVLALPSTHTFVVVPTKSPASYKLTVIIDRNAVTQTAPPPIQAKEGEEQATIQNYAAKIGTLVNGESASFPFEVQGPGGIVAYVIADDASNFDLQLKSPDVSKLAGITVIPLPPVGKVLVYQISSDVFRRTRFFEVTVTNRTGKTASPTIILSWPGFSRQATRMTGIDLLGMDYAHRPLPREDPELCRTMCAEDLTCRAYTYSKPASSGEKAICHLKSSIPMPAANACCTSGVVVVRQLTRESDTDRLGFGWDYSHFVLDQADPGACRAACALDVRCAAFTYVHPGVNSSSPECYLKQITSRPSTNMDCCDSGMGLFRTATTEQGKDRQGSDYLSFTPNPPTVEICRDACQRDPKCAAYTFVLPGKNGSPSSMCYLKNSTPPARAKGNCISGVVTGRTLSSETEVDRPGDNYSRFELTDATPEQCRTICAMDPACQAFTYVNPGYQGPKAVCYLKDRIPPAKKDACCVSGVVTK